MTTRRSLLGALGVAALGATGVAAAAKAGGSPPAAPAGAPSTVPADLPVGPKAPVVRAAGWLNSRPLSPADLAGKVVLYDFWTFGCVNCRHTQPYVASWHERYARDGLVVLSVHTPEFGYEADPDNVRRYVEENGITYPVALDPRGTVWRAFGTRYWPQFYLHDRRGYRRLTRIGEGGYDVMEGAVRALLGTPPSAPRARTPG